MILKKSGDFFHWNRARDTYAGRASAKAFGEAFGTFELALLRFVTERFVIQVCKLAEPKAGRQDERH